MEYDFTVRYNMATDRWLPMYQVKDSGEEWFFFYMTQDKSVIVDYPYDYMAQIFIDSVKARHFTKIEDWL